MDFRLLARRYAIAFHRPASGTLTAHAEITDEMARAVMRDVRQGGGADLEVPVEVMDGYGNAVATLTGYYSFRSR
jgi:hypothetical protein